MEVFVLINIRAKFTRGEELKFISHLDMMKMFERALRRSGLPVYYSQGFNPHPQIVFGLPLAVGVTSEAEYVDIAFSEYINPGQFIEQLNRQMPKGLEILEAKIKESKANIMASISKASYEVLVSIAQNPDINEVEGKIHQFLNNDEILIKKESKGKVKDVNIKPLIHRFNAYYIEKKSIIEKNTDAQLSNIILLDYIDKISHSLDLHEIENIQGYYGFSLLLAAGSIANLKPELVLQAFGNWTGFDLDVIKIHRSGLFIDKGDRTLTPLDNELLVI
mgnify:CR=1 FL=1